MTDIQDDLLQNDIHEDYQQIESQVVQDSHKSTRKTMLIYGGFVLSAIYMMVCLLTLTPWPVTNEYLATTSQIELVETVPDVLSANKQNRETFKAWLDVIKEAKKEICISAYYSTMFCEDTAENKCNDYAAQIIAALGETNATIKLLIDGNGFGDFKDVDYYQQHFKNFQVRYINYSSLFGGVQHTKLLISDSERFHLGSSNLDWRALTEVKEIGVFMRGQAETAEVQSYFDQMWSLGTQNRSQSIKKEEIERSKRIYNKFSLENPIHINGSEFYVSASPKTQIAATRTSDEKSFVDVINSAQKTLYVEAMDYAPFMIYGKPQVSWASLDDAIRKAAFRGVQVKIMTQETNRYLDHIKSLTKVKNIEFYFMKMPTLPENGGWDHTRLTHSKFAVADEKNIIITTSNLTGDYFENTAGISVVLMNNIEIGTKLANVAKRDIAS